MPELQDILNQYGKQYKQNHSLPIYVSKTLNAIEKCRTAELGAHEDVCDYCGHKKISYNSCRNRHCPKCLISAKEKWIYNQKFDVLNVQYFHVVFTIPDEFIRRFILHILPPRFMKIRHFGLLGNRNKTKKLTLCKSLTNTKVLTKEKISPLEILKKKSGIDFNLCPICRIGHLIRPNLE